MKRLARIGTWVVGLLGVGLIITAVQGFSFSRWLDAAFLSAVFGLILSGTYYLNRQKAYQGIGNSMKKFIYACIELFSRKDYTRQREALNRQTTSNPDLLDGCEGIVASAAIMIAELLIIYARL